MIQMTIHPSLQNIYIAPFDAPNSAIISTCQYIFVHGSDGESTFTPLHVVFGPNSLSILAGEGSKIISEKSGSEDVTQQ